MPASRIASISSDVATGRRINRREGFMLQPLLGCIAGIAIACRRRAAVAAIGALLTTHFHHALATLVFRQLLDFFTELAGVNAFIDLGPALLTLFGRHVLAARLALRCAGSTSGAIALVTARAGLFRQLVGRIVGAAAHHRFHLGAFAQAVDAVHHHGFAGSHAVVDCGDVAFGRTGLDVTHGDGVVLLDDIHEQALGATLERRTR